jgi:hypothetical protein
MKLNQLEQYGNTRCAGSRENSVTRHLMALGNRRGIARFLRLLCCAVVLTAVVSLTGCSQSASGTQNAAPAPPTAAAAPTATVATITRSAPNASQEATTDDSRWIAYQQKIAGGRPLPQVSGPSYNPNVSQSASATVSTPGAPGQAPAATGGQSAYEAFINQQQSKQ